MALPVCQLFKRQAGKKVFSSEVEITAQQTA